MPRSPQLLAFFAFAICVVAGMHYFLWARLFRDTGLPAAARRYAALVLGALFVSLPLANIVARKSGPSVWAWLAFSWMGVMFFLFLSLVVSDVVYLVARPHDPARRTALRRILAGVASLLAIGASAAGMVEALRRLRTVTVEIPLAKLPRAYDGFTIVQLSDIHVGSTIGRTFIEYLVERVNGMNADLVAITGDLVDGSVARLGNAIAPLANLRSKHGTFFVTGNHEYYSGAAAWCAELSRIGIRVLRNERVEIGGFDLAGVDDWHAHGMAPGHGANLAAALSGHDPARELILLAHQPRQAIEAARSGVGLQLSGHTHGGQIWPFMYVVRLQQPFIAGLDHLDGLTLYTSRGTGYWGPPMRLGAPAEITRIVLRAA